MKTITISHNADANTLERSDAIFVYEDDELVGMVSYTPDWGWGIKISSDQYLFEHPELRLTRLIRRGMDEFNLTFKLDGKYPVTLPEHTINIEDVKSCDRVFAYEDGEIVGMVVKNYHGWIVMMGGEFGAYGYKDSFKELIVCGIEDYGLEFKVTNRFKNV